MARYSTTSGLVCFLILTAAAAGQDLTPAPADLKIEPAHFGPAFNVFGASDPAAHTPGKKPKFESFPAVDARLRPVAPLDPGEIRDDADGLKHLARAEKDLRDGYYHDALSDVSHRLRCVPDCLIALRVRAFCNVFAGLAGHKPALRSAQADIARVLEKQPDDAPTRAIRGVVSCELRENIDQAVADLSYAIDHQVDGSPACFGLNVSGYRGVALMLQERYEVAIQAFNRSASRYVGGPVDFWISANRGRCFAACDRYDEAIAEFTAALERQPGDLATYRSRAQCFAGKRDFRRALADHDQIVELDANKTQAYLDRSILLSQMGENARALADADNIVRLLPNDSGAYFFRSVMWLLTRRDWDSALADIDRAIALEPRHPFYYGVRAFIRARKMDVVRACKDVALCAIAFDQVEFKSTCRVWQIDDARYKFFVGVLWRLKDAHGVTNIVDERCQTLGVEQLVAAIFASP